MQVDSIIQFLCFLLTKIQSNCIEKAKLDHRLFHLSILYENHARFFILLQDLLGWRLVICPFLLSFISFLLLLFLLMLFYDAFV